MNKIEERKLSTWEEFEKEINNLLSNIKKLQQEKNL